MAELDVAELSCEVNKSLGRVKWFRNDDEIFDSDRYEIVVEGRWRRLVVAKVTEDDMTLYSCKSENDVTSCNLIIDGNFTYYYLIVGY